jgi:hypothetical protein
MSKESRLAQIESDLSRYDYGTLSLESAAEIVARNVLEEVELQLTILKDQLRAEFSNEQ